MEEVSSPPLALHYSSPPPPPLPLLDVDALALLFVPLGLRRRRPALLSRLGLIGSSGPELAGPSLFPLLLLLQLRFERLRCRLRIQGVQLPRRRQALPEKVVYCVTFPQLAKDCKLVQYLYTLSPVSLQREYI